MASSASASAAMQSFLGNRHVITPGFSGRMKLNQFVLHRKTSFRLRNMADQGGEKEIISADIESTQKQPNPIPESLKTSDSNPVPKPKIVSTRFEDVLAFSGPGPERINGRLAMIGFVTAIGVEIAKGQDLFTQINEGGLTWFIGTSVLLTLASLIPLFKGVSAEAKSEGFMSSDAELWNGRFAMLGLVALAYTEYLKGSALV